MEVKGIVFNIQKFSIHDGLSPPLQVVLQPGVPAFKSTDHVPQR